MITKIDKKSGKIAVVMNELELSALGLLVSYGTNGYCRSVQECLPELDEKSKKISHFIAEFGSSFSQRMMEGLTEVTGKTQEEIMSGMEAPDAILKAMERDFEK